MYKVLHGLAPQYVDLLNYVTNLPGHQQLLHSASSKCLSGQVDNHRQPNELSLSRLLAQNNLPKHVTSAKSLSILRRHLKADLFTESFPGLYYN